jgi:lipopolysaccharide transport system ATP-binding protein
MPAPIITVDGLSKAYRIGLKDQIPDTLASALVGAVKSPIKKYRQLRRLNTYGRNGDEAADTIWALRDVSFEVQEGEVLGVIGRNGAGKSTLLKIISRITEPTAGRAVLRGRVSSLLEVGTGFHPELTGRDNIYMNGTILGMSKREIDAKFDEIVDFSGVEKFLDTPTKRYSSGMTVRLAFAVAAHLEPEILIVDEVLAVGDAEFQKKCMGKMQDVAKGGRTVLFVSHNIAAVEAMCTNGVYLKSGTVVQSGNILGIISRYRDDIETATLASICNRTDREGDGSIRLTEVNVKSRGGNCGPIRTGDDIDIQVHFTAAAAQRQVEISLGLFTSSGQRISWLGSKLTSPTLEVAPPGGVFTCHIDKLPLLSDIYTINLQCLVNGKVVDWIQSAAHFSVFEGDYFGMGQQYPPKWGLVAMAHHWSVEPDSPQNKLPGTAALN